MKKRILSIDFLRATAILFMTITHVNAILYLGNNPILDIFTTIGAAISFSIFLFSSAYISGIKIQKGEKIPIINTLRRVLEIYIVYILLGVLVSIVLEGDITLTKIFDIALLKHIPEFTEFLISFILFSFVSLIFQKQIRYLISKPFLFIFITIFIYMLGDFIYVVISKHTYPEVIRIVFENIFGYQSLHRFPLTYYLPLYTFGILLSKYKKDKVLIYTFITSLLIFLILYSFKLSSWNRWPPSIMFLSYGFLYIPFVLLIYRKFQKAFFNKFLVFFTRIGRYPLEQLFLSTFLLFTIRALIQPTTNEIVSILVNIFILTTLSLYPIVFRRKMV